MYTYVYVLFTYIHIYTDVHIRVYVYIYSDNDFKKPVLSYIHPYMHTYKKQTHTDVRAYARVYMYNTCSSTDK